MAPDGARGREITILHSGLIIRLASCVSGEAASRNISRDSRKSRSRSAASAVRRISTRLSRRGCGGGGTSRRASSVSNISRTSPRLLPTATSATAVSASRLSRPCSRTWRTSCSNERTDETFPGEPGSVDVRRACSSFCAAIPGHVQLFRDAPAMKRPEDSGHSAWQAQWHKCSSEPDSDPPWTWQQSLWLPPTQLGDTNLSRHVLLIHGPYPARQGKDLIKTIHSAFTPPFRCSENASCIKPHLGRSIGRLSYYPLDNKHFARAVCGLNSGTVPVGTLP